MQRSLRMKIPEKKFDSRLIFGGGGVSVFSLDRFRYFRTYYATLRLRIILKKKSIRPKAFTNSKLTSLPSSAWSIDDKPGADAIQPHSLISITAPKKCSKHFSGPGGHWIAGRFAPNGICFKYDLNLPEFWGSEFALRLPDSTQDEEDKEVDSV